MIMALSQVFLLAAIIIFALYVFRLRTILADRIIYLLMIGGGVVFVLFPRFSSWIAQLFGIGRGADLVFYLFILFSLFHLVNTTSHQNKIERQITLLVRHCAIMEAQSGGREAAQAGAALLQTDGDQDAMRPRELGV
jgi:hypothetical protein